MATRGLLIGSLLTAIPFFVFHIPLAFAQPGLNTTWEQAPLNLGLTALIAPVLSIPARNSAHRFGRQYRRDRPTACIMQRLRKMSAVPGEWQYASPDRAHPGCNSVSPTAWPLVHFMGLPPRWSRPERPSLTQTSR